MKFVPRLLVGPHAANLQMENVDARAIEGEKIIEATSGSQSLDMSVPRKSLLFLVTEDWYFCSHRLPLALAARDGGYEVTVLTRVANHADTIRSAGLNLIPIKMVRRSRGMIGELAAIRELVRLYRHIKPDIIHHVALKPVVYGSIAARIAGLRNVVNAVAGLGWLFSSDSLRAKTLRKSASLAFRALLGRGRVIVQNPDDHATLVHAGLRADAVKVIRGSGVDLERFNATPEPNGRPVVLLASRMLWEKGVGQFVDAARALQGSGSEARFVLVGVPDVENPSAVPETTLQAWHDEGVVEWWGRREDMPAVIQQAHVICLPSFYREGVPKILIEAAASGRPIITTDTPGCREIVRHQENGLLVPPRDVAALATAIERLLRDPSLRQRMGERGRMIAVDEFSIQSVVRETLGVYEELLSS